MSWNYNMPLVPPIKGEGAVKMNERKPELTIMVGFPLSGKTTYCENILKPNGWVIVSPDEVRIAIHGGQYIQNAEPYVWATVDAMVRSLLQLGHKVVVDATNISVKRRVKWTKMAKEFNITLNMLLMDVGPSVCLLRNLSIKKLDSSIIDRMVEEFEMPSDEEGNLVRIGYLEG